MTREMTRRRTAGTPRIVAITCIAVLTVAATSSAGAQTPVDDAIRQVDRTVCSLSPVVLDASADVQTQSGGVAPAADDVCLPAWAMRYDGSGSAGDTPNATIVSPDGATAFVTGESTGASGGRDYGTVAYDIVTGAQLWVARYNGPGNHDDLPAAIGVSPDGARIFVTGSSRSTTAAASADFATVAYDAPTGTQLWVARYNGPTNAADTALALAVASDGTRVFVTGGAGGLATLAYDAATGAQRWATSGTPGQGRAIAESRDGSKVIVAGTVPVPGLGNDYVTVALDSGSGSTLWTTAYDGPGHSNDVARALAIGADGSRAFVTGESRNGSGTDTRDYATVAYDVATGSQLWVARYDASGSSDVANSLAVNPDGSVLFVTGGSDGAAAKPDYGTVAYDAASGNQLWVARYGGESVRDTANALAVSPDGSAVFVAGASRNGLRSTTVQYDAATGAQGWVGIYTGLVDGANSGVAIAVVPDSTKVIVAGSSSGEGTGNDFATVAYHAHGPALIGHFVQ